MRKFRFRLEVVLKLRKSREESALRALADAQRRHQEELGRKRELLAALDGSLARREGYGARATDIAAFRTEQDFINGTKQRIIQAEQAIVRAMRGVEKALRTYLAARRQTRAMEVLHDNEYAEFRKEQAKLEQKRLDDLALMRARLKEESA